MILEGVELVIPALLLKQLVVIALLDDGAILHDEDDVGLADGREAVGNDEAGSALCHAVEGLLNADLGAGIDRGGCLIQNENGRQAEVEEALLFTIYLLYLLLFEFWVMYVFYQL